MSKQVQIRGGNNADSNAFLGVSREITVNTDHNRIVVHDGSTVGGFPLALKAEVDAKENLLGFTAEDVANKDTDSTLAANSDAKYSSQKAVKTYVDTKQAADADLTAVAALAAVGLAARTAADTWTVRTITGTSNQITVSNGDGASGNPTLSTPQDINTTAAPRFARVGLGSAAAAADLLTLTGGSVVADTKLLNSTMTWNNGAVIFTALKLDVTNTASAASSLLIDLQVGGASKFSVDKDGYVLATSSIETSGGGFYATGVFRSSAGNFLADAGSFFGANFIFNSGAGLSSTSATLFQFNGITSSYPALGQNGAAFDFLAGDGSSTINLYLYNTKVSGTNYERLDFLWASNVAKVWTEKGSGGGTARDLVLGADATELIRFQTGTKLSFYGATPIVKQTSGADLTNNVTSGGSSDVIANFTDLTVYANDSAAIRNDIYQLSRKLKQVNDALRAYGLLT